MVSIIIPVYNREDIVHETIESILKQTWPYWELLLIDDGSTDNSLKILQRFSEKDTRIKYFVRPSALIKGANGCRNFGFTKANGIYIKWVDSDDLLVPDALEKQVAIMDGNSELKVCFGQGVFFNTTTRNIEERWSRKIQSDNIQWDYIRNNVRWPIGGPLWRKDFFNFPPFLEELKNSQEWLMHGLQLLRLDLNMYTILEDTVYLIRRGNIRMSSHRDTSYYFNQAKARAILLKASYKSVSSIQFKIELIKQTGIYYYHCIRLKVRGD